MKQVFPSPSPVPSRSLSRTFTPLAKAFCAKNNPSDITIVSSKQPFETYILYYLGRSEKKNDICIPLKRQPLEHYILHYFAHSIAKFWTFAVLSKSNLWKTTFCNMLNEAKINFGHMRLQTKTHDSRPRTRDQRLPRK